MKITQRTILISVIALFAMLSLHAQGITIGSGTTVTLGSSTLSLPGNWSNSGTFTAGSGTVVFNGASGTQTITNASGETFNNLTVNKASGNVQLLNNIAVNGTLTTTSGGVDLNSHTITLGTSGTLSETAGNTVHGTSGSITTTRTLGTNPGNVAGLGLEITSSPSLGSTIITRAHNIYTSGSNSSIERNFAVTPTTNTSLNATAVFHYDVSELNSLTESQLELFASANSGTSWSLVPGGTLNTTSKTVTVSGVNSFSLWTLAATTAPLPVELASFSATSQRTDATLQWKTATEINNYGFEVEREPLPSPPLTGEGTQGWAKVGFVEGSGTTNSPKTYSFTDSDVPPGNYSYRLKQIDHNGAFKYSAEIEVAIAAAPKVFELSQNFPNPFNPSTNIQFTVPADGRVMLKVYNTLGQEVATLFDGVAAAGQYNQATFDASRLASGIYFSRLEFGGKMQIKKMLLLK
jgi:Secretion system C-terminal sorting domain